MTPKKTGPVTGKKSTSARKKTNSSKKSGGGASAGRKKNANRGEADFPIVGIGASAGGLEAFEQFFTYMPPDSGMAFVLVQHLDPTHKSILSALIRKYTRMDVVEVEDGMQVEPNRIFTIPPNRDMAIMNGKLHLMEPSSPRGQRQPIDFFFRSLAEDQRERAICIVLSGNGSEGTLGLRAVKGEGGMAMVQTPESAKYDGMPKSAIATGLADFVLGPGEMPQQLVAYVDHAPIERPDKVKEPPVEDQLEKILVLVRSHTGHDFSLYKRSTVVRRIERRMAVHQIGDTALYVRYIQENPKEAQTLFKELLIGVTNFFRDPESFESLKQKVIPRLFEETDRGKTVRVWVPGCTTGEEVYSIAMLLQEYLENAKNDCAFQIFGTDIDPDAVETARTGAYPHSISVDVSPDRLDRFLNREDAHYRVKKEIRERVVFAVQNVVSDPPFSRLDLVSCRNLLIYMGPELQKKIIPLFHYALRPDGFLFMGTSETIGGFTDLFATIDRKHKLFQRRQSELGETGVEIPIHAVGGRPGQAVHAMEHHPMPKSSNRDVAEQSLLKSYAACGALINEKQEVIYFHGQTGAYLEPPQGEASLNIVAMARQGLRIQLASTIRKAETQKKTIRHEGLSVKSNGEEHIINLVVHPIMEPPSKRGLTMIVFEPVQKEVAEFRQEPHTKRVPQKTDPRIRELEQELESTKQYLQTTIEELETSNEELKATNEELQSSNEELQSTNEELETAKEEQQSVNEELITVNSELQQKIDQLTKANDDMSNLLASTQIGTVFIDNQMKVKSFTPAATDIINLLPSDVGRPMSHIASNLDYHGIVDDIEETLRTLSPKEVEVRSKDGRQYSMRIRPYRTSENVIDGVVVTFINITEQCRMQQLAEASRRFAESIVDTVREPLVVLDDEMRVISANRSFYKTFLVTPKDTEGKLFFTLGNRQWDIPHLRELLEKVLPEKREVEDFEVDHKFEQIGRRVMLLNARQLEREAGKKRMILLAIEDITDRKVKTVC